MLAFQNSCPKIFHSTPLNSSDPTNTRNITTLFCSISYLLLQAVKFFQSTPQPKQRYYLPFQNCHPNQRISSILVHPTSIQNPITNCTPYHFAWAIYQVTLHHIHDYLSKQSVCQSQWHLNQAINDVFFEKNVIGFK